MQCDGEKACRSAGKKLLKAAKKGDLDEVEVTQ